MSKDLKPISAAIRTLADRLKGHMTVNGDTIAVPDDFYAQSLADTELTLDIVQKVQRQRGEFLAATALAQHEVAVDAMGKNKDISDITLRCKVATDESTFITHRESRQLKAPGSSEMVTVYNHQQVSYKAKATADMRNVRAHLKAIGAGQVA